jgi:outer membrane protein assembly factor BamA
MRPALLALCFAASGCAHAVKSAAWVRSLDLRGVHNVSARDLKKGLATRPAAWYERGPARPYDEVELGRDRTRVQRYYERRGYYAAKVVMSEGKPDPRGGVDVVIAVEEGAPTMIGDVRVLGTDAVDRETRAELHRYQLGLRRGQVFHHDDYMKFKTDLLRVLKKRGYADAQVEGVINIQPNDNLADITLVFLPHGSAPSAPTARQGS